MEHFIYLSKEKTTTNVSVTQHLSRCSTNSLKKCKTMSVKRQQVNPKRLPSDHDPEADSVLGRGDKP